MRGAAIIVKVLEAVITWVEVENTSYKVLQNTFAGHRVGVGPPKVGLRVCFCPLVVGGFASGAESSRSRALLRCSRLRRLLGEPPSATTAEASGVKLDDAGMVRVPVLTVAVTWFTAVLVVVKLAVTVEVETIVVVVLYVLVDWGSVWTMMLVETTVVVEVTGAGVMIFDGTKHIVIGECFKNQDCFSLPT